MPTKHVLTGGLLLKKDLTDECWTTPAQFVKLLIDQLGIEFPLQVNEDLVIYGFQTPSEDQKGKLWVKTDRAGHYSGDFLFIDGKWQRVYNHSNVDVIWKYGDSRELEPGFAIIDGTVPFIATDTQAHIMSYYKQHPDYTVPEPVYSYFATVYIGL